MPATMRYPDLIVVVCIKFKDNDFEDIAPLFEASTDAVNKKRGGQEQLLLRHDI